MLRTRRGQQQSTYRTVTTTYYFPPSEVTILYYLWAGLSTGKARPKPILGLSGFVEDRSCPSSGFFFLFLCRAYVKSRHLFPCSPSPTDGLRCCFIIDSHLSPFAAATTAIYMHYESLAVFPRSQLMSFESLFFPPHAHHRHSQWYIYRHSFYYR